MGKYIVIILIIVLIVSGVFYVTKKNYQANDGMMMNNQKVVQSHRSYTFSLLSPENNLQPKEELPIRFKITDDTGATLKTFALNHTKRMHFIIVRNDLQDFQHLHPEFNTETGEFSVPVTFQDSGRYRLFADFTPTGGQKDSEGNGLGVTLPKEITVGNINTFKPQEIVVDTQTSKNVSGYQIAYAVPQSLQAGNPVTITLNVTKKGQPVTDMEEYLGAQAHGILLKKETLDFAHLHAMGESMTHQMNGEMMDMHGALPKGPEITFDYTFPSTGIYKLFTQFEVQGKVVTTDYTMEVK